MTANLKSAPAGDTPLTHTPVMILDCQATGANPARGHLLEIGWTPYTAASPAMTIAPSVYRVELPGESEIPPHIRRITGIDDPAPKTAVPPLRLWAALQHEADRIARTAGSATCPAVIHFARFEEPFLRQLHRMASPDSRFPLDVICTHQIACRLFPELPRLGLRAIAGYFGHAVPELKRCAAHVTGTVHVWRHLVKMLRHRGICTFDALDAWVKNTPPPKRRGRVYPMKADARRNLPNRPGIYRMLRAGGDALYVGKAASLRTRVNSYFRKGARHSEHILEMLTQAVDLNATPAESGFHAAILEVDEIKRCAPPYNIALRTRGRSTGFASRDLFSHSHAADRVHVIGPLPAPDALVPLGALAAQLAAMRTHADAVGMEAAGVVLGVADISVVSPDDYAEGLRRFVRMHADLSGNLPIHRALMRAGARLWRERLLARAVGGAEPAGQTPAEQEAVADHGETGTPEWVAFALNALVRRSAHWVRRGRWFCLLSESVVRWEPSGAPRKNPNTLAFRNGRLHHSGGTPERRRPLATRLDGFTIDDYDRMRVATAELRRLVSARRPVAVRFSPTVCLGREKLARILRWV